VPAAQRVLRVRSRARAARFVAYKAAITLDGRLATAGGDSALGDGPRGAARGHRLRDAYDAILVGARTVRVDDPELTTRLPGGRGRDPVRVIVGRAADDAARRAPAVLGSAAPTIIVGAAGAPAVRRRRLERAGAEVWALPAPGGRLDLTALLAALRARDILSVLVEGGGETAAGFLEAQLIDKVVAFVAPKLLGGRDATPMVRRPRGPADGRRRHARRVRLPPRRRRGYDHRLCSPDR